MTWAARSYRIPWLKLLTGVALLSAPMLSAQNRQQRYDPSRYSKAYIDSLREAALDTSTTRYRIRAYRLTAQDRIQLDGRLDEAAWQQAEHQGRFTEKDPYPYIEPDEQTEFAVLYDANNLYIGVWCWESEPDKIVWQLQPRGNSSPDNLQIFIDTYHDHRTGYKFNVTPAGVQNDELRFDDVKRDANWDGIWYSAGSRDRRGWYAELKIPFFNMRFRALPEHLWGFTMLRTISKSASRSNWVPHLPEWEMNTRMSRLGHLAGLSGIRSGRHLEVRPYGLAGSSKAGTAAPDQRLSAGLDLRFNPANNFTADLAVNPDFAQVDADVADINLTRFPTRFSELRPFFTERTNIFNTPMELFYSRRIGSRGDILGGLKITGKTSKGFEYGLLSCRTGHSMLANTGNDAAMAEKATFTVARLKKDLFNSSSLGILAAGKEMHNGYDRVMGIDGTLVMPGNFFLDYQAARRLTRADQPFSSACKLLLTRTGDLLGFDMEFNRTEAQFDINGIGYVKKEPDRGWQFGRLNTRFGPRIYGKHIRRIYWNSQARIGHELYTREYLNTWLQQNPALLPAAEFGAVQRKDNGSVSVAVDRHAVATWQWQSELLLDFNNEMQFTSGLGRYRESEVTGRYSGHTWYLNYTTKPVLKGARFAGNWDWQAGSYYNFAQKYLGTMRRLRLGGEGQLTYQLTSDLQLEFARTCDPSGRTDGRFWQLSSYTSFMFTKDFYVRLQLRGRFATTWYDVRTMKNDYLISALMSWQYRPGSYFFIAYNEGRDDLGDELVSRYFLFRNRTVLAKLSYYFTI